MTIYQIEKAAAAMLSHPAAPITANDFVVDGQDLALMFLNQIRLQAEMAHDFNFQRKLLTLSVDVVTGGSLDSAVIYGTDTSVDIKTIVDIGTFDMNGNFRPAVWTTAEESQVRQRQENPFDFIRYPTDAQAQTWPGGQRRFVLANNNIWLYPRSQANDTGTVVAGIEAYCHQADWTGAQSVGLQMTGTDGQFFTFANFANQGSYNNKTFYAFFAEGVTESYGVWFDTDSWYLTNMNGVGVTSATGYKLTSPSPLGTYVGINGATGTYDAVTGGSGDVESDIWTTKGQQYLLYQLIVELNGRFKFYVPRTEGNLAPPQQLATEGLQKLIDWDVYRYEQFRSHGQ